MMSGETSFKVFIRGVAQSIDENALELAFSKYGRIMEVQLIRDKETKVSRGFGFITFECTGDAEDAVRGMNGQSLGGSNLFVGIATEKPGYSHGGSRGRGGRGGFLDTARGRGRGEHPVRGHGGPGEFYGGAAEIDFNRHGPPPPRFGFPGDQYPKPLMQMPVQLSDISRNFGPLEEPFFDPGQGYRPSSPRELSRDYERRESEPRRDYGYPESREPERRYEQEARYGPVDPRGRDERSFGPVAIDQSYERSRDYERGNYEPGGKWEQRELERGYGPPDPREPERDYGPPNARELERAYGPPDLRGPERGYGPPDARGPERGYGVHEREPGRGFGPSDSRGLERAYEQGDPRGPERSYAPPDARGFDREYGLADTMGPERAYQPLAQRPDRGYGLDEARIPEKGYGPGDVRVPERGYGPGDVRSSERGYGPADVRSSEGGYGPADVRSERGYDPADVRSSERGYGPADVRSSERGYGPADSRRSERGFGPEGREPVRGFGSNEMRGDRSFDPNERGVVAAEPRVAARGYSEREYGPMDSQRMERSYGDMGDVRGADRGNSSARNFAAPNTIPDDRRGYGLPAARGYSNGGLGEPQGRDHPESMRGDPAGYPSMRGNFDSSSRTAEFGGYPTGRPYDEPRFEGEQRGPPSIARPSPMDDYSRMPGRDDRGMEMGMRIPLRDALDDPPSKRMAMSAGGGGPYMRGSHARGGILPLPGQGRFMPH